MPAGTLTLFPGASLALIKSSATSVRLHAAAPSSYAASVSTLAASENNWLLTSMSLATSTNIGAPVLTQNP